MIELVLLLVLVIWILKAYKPMRRFAAQAFPICMIALVGAALLFEKLNGAHPECGVNDSVGPCDYWGRIKFDVPLVVFGAVALWLFMVIVRFCLYAWMGTAKKQRGGSDEAGTPDK